METKDKSLQLFSNENKNLILNFFRADYSTCGERHRHPHSEYLLVTEGCGKIELEKGVYIEVASGDILFFDSMQPHKIIPQKGNALLSVISLTFDIQAFITEDYRVFNKRNLDIFFSQIRSAENKIVGSAAEKLNDIFYELEEELSNITDNSEAVIKSLVILMFSYTVRHYNEKFEHFSVRRLRHYSEVQKTMVYINENLSDNLTLEQLAKIANLNKSYYSTIFKKVTGMTVWEYILNARIELAISYLVKDNADYNITEILGLCGFNNASAFNKTFKKMTGKTPTEFKNSKYNSCFSK